MPGSSVSISVGDKIITKTSIILYKFDYLKPFRDTYAFGYAVNAPPLVTL